MKSLFMKLSVIAVIDLYVSEMKTHQIVVGSWEAGEMAKQECYEVHRRGMWSPVRGWE